MASRVLLFLTFVLSAAGPERIVVRPRDSGAALVNPGMGWVFHHYDNGLKDYGAGLAPSDTVDEFPGASTVYLRLAWSYIEPEEGRFDWPVVDTPAQRWIAKGKRVALRFTASETNLDQPYATPEWVRKAGSKGYFFNYGQGIDPRGSNWEPDYDDPVFLEKLAHFLAAAGARYDGNPELAFIDVGTLGAWGEGHTIPSTRKPYSAATALRQIDLYHKYFPHSLVVVNDDFSLQGRGIELFEHARELGMGFRDDSILVEKPPHSYYHAYLATPFWPTTPVVLECEHYGPSAEDGAWGDGSLYLKAIEDYHASYASVHWYPREFLKANQKLIDRINLRLGYRLQLLEASWPSEVGAASTMLVGYRWRNDGVAPCLPGGHPAITLKDDRGGIAAVFADEDFDMRALPVGEPGQAEAIGRELKKGGERLPQSARPLARFQLPPASILKPGNYAVYISVGTRTGTPRIALPLAGDDGQHRYKLGGVRVLPQGATPPEAPQSAEDWW
ncbi:MAG: DUF4832 domain-containing protein [Bryobacteraceae bacterium]